PARLLTEDVRRLQVLVAELLELAHFDAGHEQARLERLCLAEALRALTRSWDGSAPVHLDADDDVFMLADRARFKRVVGNLLDNARTYGGDGVEVRGYQDGDRVVVEVHDRGPGIDEADLERVFDRFFKGDHSRSTGGSGLGLAIALENARLQGGHLSAHNLEGGGACFSFTLRAAPATCCAEGEHGAGESGRGASAHLQRSHDL
ncbi:MAG: sensor histidine kinase, partial [Acidimicrobiia bacterium]